MPPPFLPRDEGDLLGPFPFFKAMPVTCSCDSNGFRLAASGGEGVLIRCFFVEGVFVEGGRGNNSSICRNKFCTCILTGFLWGGDNEGNKNDDKP